MNTPNITLTITTDIETGKAILLLLSADEIATVAATVTKADLGDSAPAPTKAKVKAKAKVAPAPVEDDEEETDEEEGDGEITRELLEQLERDELKSVADDLDVEYGAKTRTATLIDAILAAVEAGDEETDEEEDDEAEEDDDSEETDEEETDDDEEEAEEEGGEFWTKAELTGKPIGELKAIAKDYDIDTKGKDSATLIKMILA